jgi:hypothetical protein
MGDEPLLLKIAMFLLIPAAFVGIIGVVFSVLISMITNWDPATIAENIVFRVMLVILYLVFNYLTFEQLFSN